MNCHALMFLICESHVTRLSVAWHILVNYTSGGEANVLFLFGKTKLCGIKWIWRKKTPNCLGPSDTHCVSVQMVFHLWGVMGCIWQMFRENLFTLGDTITSSLTPFSPIFKVFLATRHFRVLTFYWVMKVYGDVFFYFDKCNQWMFMRERSKRLDPHRFSEFNFCFD